MNKSVSRRDLLKFFAVTAGSVTMCGDFAGVPGATQTPDGVVETTEEDKRSFLPLISTTTPPPAENSVAHVHSDNATSWNGETDFWNYVDQDVVNNMVDQGLMALTGASSVADAWLALLPSYQPGQAIAIKANLNNSKACDDLEGQIDALIQPVNAVARGLIEIGVRESDIWVYEAVKRIPDWFVTGCSYPSIRFFDRFDDGCREPAGWTSNDPNAIVTFSLPPGVPQPREQRITDVAIDAAYLINMPILKRHSLTGVTLGFKNHLGTIGDPYRLHEYVGMDGSYFHTDYSTMVDIYRNPHIGPKTVLTIGDGLFASKWGTTRKPDSWTTFGNEVPNSLFFARDPVALDCVMCDLLAAEIVVPVEAAAYLQVASDAGLGVFERGDPWGAGYQQIAYTKITL